MTIMCRLQFDLKHSKVTYNLVYFALRRIPEWIKSFPEIKLGKCKTVFEIYFSVCCGIMKNF